MLHGTLLCLINSKPTLTMKKLLKECPTDKDSTTFELIKIAFHELLAPKLSISARTNFDTKHNE